MPVRSGVSLIEVLVAALLLAVGVGGAVAATQVAATFRERAAAVERVALAAHARLDWFHAAGCAAPDTLIRETAPDRPTELWRVSRALGAATLEGAVSVGEGPRSVRLPLRTSRACP